MNDMPNDMPTGKYDFLATAAREAAGAEGVVLMVFSGYLGSGFSVQLPLPIIPTIPDLLRRLADDIEADLKKREPQ